MSLKLVLGSVAFACSMISIWLNMLIFIPVFRLAFISKKSTVYIIAFFNVISDLCQLATIGFYLSPCIIADGYFLSGEVESTLSVFIGIFFLFAWYFECLVQDVMAVNRLTIITFKKYNVFTFRFTLFLFFFLIFLTSATAITNQYLLPCCVFVLDHKVLTLRFIFKEGLHNYTNNFLLSYDLFSTFISIICYTFVFLTIKNTGNQVANNVSRDRNKQDKRYLLQFVFISIFYVATWVLFEILPHIVPEGQVEWYVVVPILVTLNCSSNSVIYLSVNKEVQKSLPIPWLRNRFIKAAIPSAAGKLDT